MKKLWGLVEMMFGLVNASFSLPKWQAVKMIFFAPWTSQYRILSSSNSFFELSVSICILIKRRSLLSPLH